MPFSGQEAAPRVMQRFASNLPIRKKVALAFAVILLVAMGPSLAAMWGLAAVHQASEQVRQAWLPAARLLGEMGRAYARLRITDTRIAVTDDPVIIKRGRQLAVGNLDTMLVALRTYEALALPPEERQAVAARAAIFENYMKIRAEVGHFADAGNINAARDLWFGEANLKFRAYNDLLDISIARMTNIADNAIQRSETIYRISLWLLLLGAITAVAAAIGTGLALIFLIARPITNMVQRLGRLAEGDLSVDIPIAGGRDEVGAMGRALLVFKHNAGQMVQREADLLRTNVQFEAALTNMSQGLCMYDVDGQLAVVNIRYSEIFRVPADEIRLGMSREQSIKLRAQYGNHDKLSTATLLAMADKNALENYPTLTMDAVGGRIIEVSNCPMPAGGWVTTYADITDRRRAEEQVVFLARHDALTGLPNRTLFQERVEQELANVGRGSKAAILCLDLDRFKAVNDTFGHPVGDTLLSVVAERLRAAVREVDMVARLGGDEFAVVQIGAERPEDVAKLASRIVEVLGQPYMIDRHEVIIGASVGIAMAPADGTYFDKLLRCADMALYRAKLDGRGSFCFFEEAMDEQLQARYDLEHDMRRALAADEFEMFYQPLVNLQRGEISGFEALMRWRHTTRGLVYPTEFIPVAEETGLIVRLGEWALRTACAEAVSWPGSLSIAVNLSPVQFKSQTLVPIVIDALARAGLPGSRLELEITESIMLQDGPSTLATLYALRDLGVRIAMDDFGTGYSSLSYLRSFPFDKIKIDQSFIRDLGKSRDSASIVRAVTSLGTSLGMSTTAEGVETQAQLEQLRQQSCTEVQGYLFSRPCPASEIASLLRKSREDGWISQSMPEPADSAVL